MAEDFRSMLKEEMRNEATGERWFGDLNIGDVLFLSIQASALHGCTPAKLIEDVTQYDAFQVTVQIKPKVMIYGDRGVLPFLESKPWWPLFSDESPILYVAENVAAGTVQEIYDDLQAGVREHPEFAPRRCGCGLKPC